MSEIIPKDINSTSKITFKTISIEKENFLRLVNPDQQIVDTQGYIAYHTGIYGNKTDNAFPDLCIDLYTNGASVHQNLINLKASLILGNNLQAEDDAKESILNPFIAKRNKSGDNLKTIYQKSAKDYALFDAAVLQIVYNREGQIAEIYHIPTQNFRLGSPNKYGQIEFGYISQNWGIIQNSTQSKGVKNFVKIRMFDPTNWKKYPVQLMYLKDYSYTHYAIPSYTAAINWILVSREISDFHLNNLKSNMMLSGLLTQKKGGMTDLELEENSQAIEKFYGGSKGRKILLAYVDDLINDKPDFQQFTGDNQDKMFDILSQQAFQQIITAHRAYSILGGLDSKGADLGGDSNKIILSLSSFNSLVTENMKQILLDGLNRICEVNELPALTCYTEMPKITVPQTKVDDLTLNERRTIVYGLPEIDDSSNTANNSNDIPGM